MIIRTTDLSEEGRGKSEEQARSTNKNEKLKVKNPCDLLVLSFGVKVVKGVIANGVG